jgi:hypothetical protein
VLTVHVGMVRVALSLDRCPHPVQGVGQLREVESGS